MRLLIDVNHPAHVHIFKNIAKRICDARGSVLFTARDKDVTVELLERYGLSFITCSCRSQGIAGLLRELFARTYAIYKAGKDFRPDAVTSHGSPCAAWASQLLGIPHIALEDTDKSLEQTVLYWPFTRYILTPKYYGRNLGKRQIRYSGFHETAYLHPDVFTPDRSLVESLGIVPGTQYSVLRFVSWQATHDIGQKGFSVAEKETLLAALLQRGPVILSCEGDIESSLQEKCISTPVEYMHHVLAFARVYVGEGGTMASECAMLGTPAVYINPISAGVLKEQERCGLLFHAPTVEKATRLACSILEDAESQALYAQRRQTMLQGVEDLNALMLSTLEKAIEKYSCL